jgi:hypothetical protein
MDQSVGLMTWQRRRKVTYQGLNLPCMLVPAPFLDKDGDLNVNVNVDVDVV